MDDFDDDEQFKGRPGAPVDFGRVLQSMLPKWYWVLVAGAIGAVVGLFVAFTLIKPSYTARTTILWEAPPNGDKSERALLTQVDSIKLPVNLREIRKRLGLKLRLEAMKEKIQLLFDGGTNLVIIEVSDEDGQGAAALANETVQAFLDYQKGVVRARGEERLHSLEADVEVAKARRNSARQELDAFRKEKGVSDFHTEHAMALKHAVDMRQQSEASAAEVISEEARERKLATEMSQQSRVVSSGSQLTSPEAMQLASLRTQLATARTRLSEGHPQIRSLQAQIGTLQTRVRNNVNQVRSGSAVTANAQYLNLKAGISSSKVSREVAIERKATYEKFAREAEKRLEVLSRSEGEANRLRASLERASERLEEVEGKLARARDEWRSASSDFRVVTPASVPERADRMKRRATAIKFPVMAMVVALAVLLGRALRGLRVHTATEAGYWANSPVIASSTWPRQQEALGALVDELGDYAPLSRGSTLVVSARVNDVPLAREVAYWLTHFGGLGHRVVGDRETARASTVGVAAAGPVTPPAPQASGDGQGPESTGSALARRPGAALTRAEDMAVAQAWDGPVSGPSLRRAARLADRVLVVVASGTLSMLELTQLRTRLGRTAGIALLIVGLDPSHQSLPDRVGSAERFWQARA